MTHATELRLTTWNMLHMMGETRFTEWAKFCNQANWNDDTARARGLRKPAGLTYCDAHTGMLYPQFEVRESAPVHTLAALKQKAEALKTVERQLKSDLYALQEISDEEAIRSVFPADQFDVIAANFKGANNVGWAIRKPSKGGAATLLAHKTIDSLAQADDKGRRVRPGHEITIRLGSETYTLLNIHLKASCRNHLISDPDLTKARSDKHAEEITQACAVLRRQVPELETWMDEQVRAGNKFAIAGDWNRDLLGEVRTRMPARLDGSSAADPIKPDTQIGSILFELSDDEPKGARLHVARVDMQQRKKLVKGTRDRNYADVCHKGIDNIALSESWLHAWGLERSDLQATGQDYGAQAYGADKVLPSDHCPVTLNTRMRSP